METVGLATVKKEDFDKYLNTDFTMHIDNQGSEPLKLVKTIDKSNANMDAFVLYFLGDFSEVYPQKIYTLTHTQMGEISIFIVPINKSEKGVTYEAIFTRMKNV